jgi:hypothetical protein
MKRLLKTTAKSRNRQRSRAFVLSLVVILVSCQSTRAVRQIDQFGITWMFDKDYPIGRFANGDYWVVGPVTIVGIDPPSVKADGRVTNVSMVNPSPRLARKQGYDSAIYGRYAKPGDYEASLNVARPNGRDISKNNPLVVNPGSSLVSTISTQEEDGRIQLRTAAVLTVLDGAAPQGSFRPPYCGTEKAIRFNKAELNYSLLAGLKPVPGSPSLTTVERYFERPWLDHVGGWEGRHVHPADNMPAYDRDVCTQVGVAALMLHLNFTNQEKETLLIRYIQLGIDLYGVVQDGGAENWQQDSGRKYPIMFAGLMLSDPDMMNIGAKSGDYAHTAPYGPGNPPPDLVRFEEDETTFYVSQVDVDMTHSPQWRGDFRDATWLPYEEEDINLPEWGIVRLYDRTGINKSWETSYRRVIGQAYGGFVLAMHIMGVKDLWNHDALFDYKDRYMEVESDRRETSRFVERMWDVYRADFGLVWTMAPVLNVTSHGGRVVRAPDKAAYSLGERVRLRAVPDPGYRFEGWSGGLVGQENPATIVMHADRSVTASFSTLGSASGKEKYGTDAVHIERGQVTFCPGQSSGRGD